MFYLKSLVLTLTVPLLLISCAKDNLAEVSLPLAESPEISFRAVGDGPASKPTRTLESITTTNHDTGEQSTTFACIIPGKTCDVGAITGSPTEDIDFGLLAVRKNALSELEKPNASDLKHFFANADLESLFPYVYSNDVFTKIMNEEWYLSLRPEMLLVIDDDHVVTFAYTLN